MKKFSAAVLMIAGVLAVVSASQADTRRTRDPGVNARQHHQRERIQQGVVALREVPRCCQRRGSCEEELGTLLCGCSLRQQSQRVCEPARSACRAAPWPRT